MGGVNKSITNSLDDLKAYWAIEPVSMKGVLSSIKIMCTHRGTCNLIARNGNIIPILVHYSPHASHCMISPNDTVVSNHHYSSWTQHADFKISTGHIRFNSPSGLISNHEDLVRHNNLWFLVTPRCAVSSQKPKEQVINVLSSDLTHELWHHRLFQLGVKPQLIIHKHCYGVPN